MKKITVFLVFLMVAVGAVAQNCAYHASAVPGAVLSYTFYPDSSYSSTASTFDWTINGTTISTPIPSYQFPGPGNYPVCIDYRDTTGNLLCSYCDTLTVSGPATCNLSYAPDSINPMNIYFYGVLSGTANSLHWDFGDSTVGSGTSTSHHYATAGVYVVCMTESDQHGNVVCSQCSSIYVSPAGVCGINAVNLQGSTYMFQVAIPLPGAYSVWDYGDNHTGYGTSVYHSYTSNGTFTVCVTQYDSAANVLCSSCTTLVVNGGVNCQISYQNSPAQPNVFYFAASAPGITGAVAYSWDFGDGTTGTGHLPQHTYAIPGVYTVCVSITGGGAVFCNTCITVLVQLPLSSCSANFVSSSQSLTAFFIDQSNGTALGTGYTWDFGDGTTSVQRFPQHTYANPGFYTVCLTISDTNCNDHYCASIYVDTATNGTPNCQAYFVKVQVAPFQLSIVNMSVGSNLSYQWDFGDGSPVYTQPYPSHTYASNGMYVLCLTITDGLTGCHDTWCDTVGVDSSGNILRTMTGFTINVVSPEAITGLNTTVSSLPGFNAYPNPFTAYLQVDVPYTKLGKATYRVLTLQGNEAAHGAFYSDRQVLDLSKLPPGSYILEVKSKDGSTDYRSLIKN